MNWVDNTELGGIKNAINHVPDKQAAAYQSWT